MTGQPTIYKPATDGRVRGMVRVMLVLDGLSQAEVARRTGVSRELVRQNLEGAPGRQVSDVLMMILVGLV